MKGKTYDMQKLSASGKFDISVSTRFYYTTQEYFDALTDFEAKYNRELNNYTAAFVINADEDREAFMQECYEIRAIFVRLGADALLESLLVLENAAISRNMNVFSDGQVNFRATVKICKDIIKNSCERWRMTRPDAKK